MIARIFAIFALVCVSAPALAYSPPPLSAYGELPAVEDMALAPDGDSFAVIGTIQGKRRLVITNPDSTLRSSAIVGDAKTRSLSWISMDQLLLIVSHTKLKGQSFRERKSEESGALLVDADSGKTEMIFKKDRKIYDAVYGYYGIRRVDDRLTAFFAGAEIIPMRDGTYEFTNLRDNRPGLSLFAVDARKKRARKIGKATPVNKRQDWIIDQHGTIAATMTQDIGDGSWTIENAKGSVIASGPENGGAPNLTMFGKDGDTVIYSFSDGFESQALGGLKPRFEVPLAGGTPTPVLPNTYINSVFTDRLSGKWLGYIENMPDGSARPTLFDPAHQSAMDKIFRAFSGAHSTIVSRTENFEKVILLRRGNKDAGTYYLVDTQQLSAHPIGFERPQIKPNQVGPISAFAYEAGDGLALDGILTLPPHLEAENLPVIIFPHGGPHSHDTANFDWWAQAFASRGYAVFQPNFRGSTNRDRAFKQAGHGQWGRKMQTDISDGLAALAEAGIVDPARACIMGGSYGGYAALAGVTLQQNLYRCAVAVAPVADLRKFYNYEGYASGYAPVFVQSMIESMGDPSGFDAVSPRQHAAKADAPILLIHGKDDTIVRHFQSKLMADALDDAGKPYEFLTLDGEDHWLSRPETRQQMLEAAMRFIQKHNPAD